MTEVIALNNREMQAVINGEFAMLATIKRELVEAAFYDHVPGARMLTLYAKDSPAYPIKPGYLWDSAVIKRGAIGSSTVAGRGRCPPRLSSSRALHTSAKFLEPPSRKAHHLSCHILQDQKLRAELPGKV